jgi:hypothetical protein
LVDAFCTLRHVALGAREVNPVMAELLDGGGLRFVTVKHALVSLCVCALLMRSQERLARGALIGIFVLFAALAVYHGVLWMM